MPPLARLRHANAVSADVLTLMLRLMPLIPFSIDAFITDTRTGSRKFRYVAA